MQPSLAQIATALVSLTLIAMLAVVFDGHEVDDTYPPREVELRAPGAERGDPKERDPVIITEGGRAIPGIAALEYRRGQMVRFAVASDQRDTVHVRGSYGIKTMVTPGEPAQLEFPARQAGSFGVELDSAKNQIASVRVKP